MDNNLESVYNDYNKEIGRLFGQSVNILRPPGGYTVDQTPTAVYSSQPFKVEKVGPILAQPGMYNMEYYAIFGDFSLLQKGDQIVPVEANSDTPITTFINKSPGEGARAFRSSRTCRITTSLDEDNIYTNVRFDYLPTGYNRTQFDDLVLAAGGKPIRIAVMYSLPGLQDINADNYDVIGLKLIETGGLHEQSWTVKFVEELYPLMQLTLERS